MNEQEHSEIIARLDRIEAFLTSFIEYVKERDAGDYDRDVSANLLADFIFEAAINPDSFFDRGKNK